MGKEDEGSTVGVCSDRIGSLPDELLHCMLSFLPAEDVVRTCVLARRWRHLWKCAPGLRIGWSRDEPMSVIALQKFVDCLFLLRGGLPLDTVDLRFGDFLTYADEHRVNLWFRHSVLCKVRVLKLHIDRTNYLEPWLLLDDLPLASKHLTRLELHYVQCCTSFLDFSSCPTLEHLEFEFCDFSLARKMSSQSLKCLSMIESHFSDNSCFRINAPNLVSFHLDEFWECTPILESVPSLAEVLVRIHNDSSEWYGNLLDGNQNCICDYCDSSGNCCGLLKGLSKAKSLALICRPQTLMFKRDLTWCPIFSNLKTLLLNDYWCVPDNLRALACILEHSPVLEMLTLQLFSEGPKHKIELKGSFSSMERSAGISEHLRIVEIKCEVVDERVLKVLKFLCTFNISFTC